MDCDLRELETVDAYYDQSTFDAGTAAADAISKHVPELNYQIYAGDEAQKRFRVSTSCVGAIVYSAAQLSSYKFVTQVVEMLVKNGINLQTETPVTRINSTHDKSQWIIETSQGNIVTPHVVHATNGYAQYLLPSFESRIKPTRGFMTAQVPPKNLLKPQLDRSYSLIYGTGDKFDYLIQQPPSYHGMLMLGGGLHQDPHPNTFNDAEIPDSLQSYLLNQLPKVLCWGDEDSRRRLHMCWCGIMGFSKDEVPWVGAVPESIGGGTGQWICAGYTGDGTVCFWPSNVRNDKCPALCRGFSNDDSR